jgi:tetratricopeptide (TPR) repeat protein
LTARGQIAEGLKTLEDAQDALMNNQRRAWYAYSNGLFGMVYAQMTTGPLPTLGVLARNIGFLAKSIPFSAKKAEEHFNSAIDLSREIGAKAFLGLAYLNMGLLHQSRKRTDQARECLTEASRICRECDAHFYLKQAEDALKTMK